MLGIGMQEILIILVVALVVIGPKRLPEVARTLGKGFAEFKKATDDFQETVRKDLAQEKHEDFVKKYPHLVPEEEGAGEAIEKEDPGPPTGDGPSGMEPEPAYKPDEIEGGEEAEKETRDV
jgi:Tat protein translocase TatB subunit